MFIVEDRDNLEVVGPFDSKEQATKYFTTLAQDEGWEDTVRLINETGSPFGPNPWAGRFGDQGMHVHEVTGTTVEELNEVIPWDAELFSDLVTPDSHTMSKI